MFDGAKYRPNTVIRKKTAIRQKTCQWNFGRQNIMAAEQFKSHSSQRTPK